MKIPVHLRPTYSLGTSPEFDYLATLARKNKQEWRKISNLVRWGRKGSWYKLVKPRFPRENPDLEHALLHTKVSIEAKKELRRLFII